MGIQVDVRSSGVESAYIAAPFDVAKAELEKEGYHIISNPQNAQLRIAQGKDSFVSRNGNLLREGILYLPGKESRLVRNSPILNSAGKATQEHREKREFYVTWEEAEEFLKDSIGFPRKNIEIPTKRLGDEELTIFAIGGGDSGKAGQYGDFLFDAGIEQLPIYALDSRYVDQQSKPFARQLWFRNLGQWSDIYVDGRNLYSDWRVRGMRSVSA